MQGSLSLQVVVTCTVTVAQIGIYNTGTLVVYGKVMGNTARWGGGVYNDGGTVTIHGVVSGNISMPSQGGGILHDDGMLTINGSISGNTAATQGDGIYFRVGTIIFKSENLIQDNTANGGPGMGGGIYNNGGTFSGVLPKYGSGNSFENCVGAGGCP